MLIILCGQLFFWAPKIYLKINSTTSMGLLQVREIISGPLLS